MNAHMKKTAGARCQSVSEQSRTNTHTSDEVIIDEDMILVSKRKTFLFSQVLTAASRAHVQRMGLQLDGGCYASKLFACISGMA